MKANDDSTDTSGKVDEKELFADSETGFASMRDLEKPPPVVPNAPPPPPQFQKVTMTYNSNVPLAPPPPVFSNKASGADDEFSRVAPPVAFSASTQTISANRKSMFSKDLAAQEDEKTHQEAMRILKRNSQLKQERERKPVRRESSKRPALNMAGLRNDSTVIAVSKPERALSPVSKNELLPINLAPSEAVKQEQVNVANRVANRPSLSRDYVKRRF